jgi:hypothetical protein
MSAPVDFSPYISRAAEQRRILEELATVRETGRSRVVMLYGSGGAGKTRLVRHLAERLPGTAQDQKAVWLPPVDVDDSQHWLLSNLERYVADQLDPERDYFQPFHEYVSKLPPHGLTPTSRDTVLSHLNRVKEIFADCYENYISGTGSSVVITFDTIEAIRGMYLSRVLTRWMRALPGTLFILAGRAPSGDSELPDPIWSLLKRPPVEMHVATVQLDAFDMQDCRAYLAPISKEANLRAEETDKLVYLTQGSPLWLAFAVDYLAKVGLPPEMSVSLQKIKTDLPRDGEPTLAGRDLIESFKTHLVAPYQAADFWREAIKRLAVVRESISQPIWTSLMADKPLPTGVASADQAWETLLTREWIRPRANKRYITLHDAVAEELAQRVISIHDHDGQMRKDLWEKATALYAGKAEELERQVDEEQSAVDSRLAELETKGDPGTSRQAAEDEAAVMRDVAALDRHRQELHQLQAAHLFYLLLSDPRQGARRFAGLLHQARMEHDVLFEDLLAFQMQRFLPGEAEDTPLRDTVGGTIGSFREWLRAEGSDSYADIGLEMAAYLIDRDQHRAALGMLRALPSPHDHQRRYRRHNLQGNACLRIPDLVRESGEHFRDALDEADRMPLPERYQFQADAHKELGFYYRNIGRWSDADQAYKQARNAIWRARSADSADAGQEQTASIYTNWAYLKGIGGGYDDGISLVETAIELRRSLGKRHEQAISLSVKGEVYRYHRRFKEAWEAYREAEQLFRDLTSVSWLGVIFQEQAICLFQSVQAGGPPLEPAKDAGEEAETLILQSLRVCKELNVRYYPSALNRAGRIFGQKDPDRGLGYLLEGADRAQELSDGWFWMANLVEAAELCYQAWLDKGDPKYLGRIPEIADKRREAETANLKFPELRGRWNVLHGHLALGDAIATGDPGTLEKALDNYRVGFPLITHGWVGSYGASAAITTEFGKLKALAKALPAEIRARWQRELYLSWSEQEESATQLLARLEELS